MPDPSEGSPFTTEAATFGGLPEALLGDLTYQRYGASPALEGVELQPLLVHTQLEGSLSELIRLRQGRVEGMVGGDWELAQLTWTEASPWRINAFHLHPKRRQDEVWIVLRGTLKVWLVDLRTESPTSGLKACYHLTGGRPARLFLPWGVAHGYQAGAEGASILYGSNSQFDPQDPNEGRLPWDYFGAELWQPDRG